MLVAAAAVRREGVTAMKSKLFAFTSFAVVAVTCLAPVSASALTVVVRSSGVVQHPTPNDFFSTEATCATGEVATGWGFRGDSDPRHFGSLRHAVPIPQTP